MAPEYQPSDWHYQRGKGMFPLAAILWLSIQTWMTPLMDCHSGVMWSFIIPYTEMNVFMTLSLQVSMLVIDGVTMNLTLNNVLNCYKNNVPTENILSLIWPSAKCRHSYLYLIYTRSITWNVFAQGSNIQKGHKYVIMYYSAYMSLYWKTLFYKWVIQKKERKVYIQGLHILYYSIPCNNKLFYKIYIS